VTESWPAFAFGAVFASIFLWLWISFGAGLGRSFRSLLHPRAVEEFARDNGWSYEDRGWRPLRPGPPYWAASNAACTHVVSGTHRGDEFVAYEYNHQAQVVSIKLPLALPFVEVRPQGLEGGTTVTVPNVTLESEDFNDRFWVHADDAKFASDFLHPRLMRDLLLAPPLCWRVWDDDLVGWWPGEPAPARILLYLAVLHAIKEAIPAFVWHDYGVPDTFADESAADPR
jgi:hypothetical protein